MRLIWWHGVSIALLVLALGLSSRAQDATNINALDAEVVRLYQVGKYAEAIPIATQVVVLRETALGGEHPDVAESLNNLGELYRALGRYDDAEPLHKRSLAIRETVLGRNHPDVAESLNNLAALYRDRGRYADAEPLLKRSLAIHEMALGHNHPRIATSLNNLAELYRNQGRYADAEPVLKRSLAIRETALGADHPDVANSLNNLALLYTSQGRYAEAEPLYKRSLAIHETALGHDHPHVAASLDNLASLYQSQGRYGDAEPLYRRSLTIREATLGRNHPDVAISLNNQASLYRDQGRYAEAEPLSKRSLTIREAALGAAHPDVATSLNNLAGLYSDQGRYADAEPLYRRSLGIRETALGRDHPDVAASLNNLAELCRTQGRYAEAEPLLKRSLAIHEAALGRDHPDVATSLNNLAELYGDQGRYAEAQPLLKRSLVIREAALGRDHPDVAASLNNLAELYRHQRRYAEAEPLRKRSLALNETALGRDHPRVADSLNNLASLYQSQGRYGEAEPLYRRSLAIRETVLGREHPDVATSLNNLASLYYAQGRFTEAEPLFKRSLAIREIALGPENPDIAIALNNLAFLYLSQRHWMQAAEYWRRSTRVIQRRAERGVADGDEHQASRGEASRLSWQFHGLVKVAYRLKEEGHEERETLSSEMFKTAQWAQASEAAASLAQMAARSAMNNPALATLVRERQDLVGEWKAKDKTLIGAKSEPPDRRNVLFEAALANRLAAIDGRLAEVAAQLAANFPDYTALSNPKPLSLVDVQSQLRNDDALVLFLDTGDSFKPVPQETFIWVVTKTASRWVRSDVGTNALKGRIAALRCGLDASAWQGDGLARCNTLFGLSPQTTPPDTLPFDLYGAHALYKDLLGNAEDLIKDKHLLIVPSGPLTQLPFHVLVTDAPASPDDYTNAAWLAKRHAITVLPSVASLTALRRNAKRSAAPEPFIGYGDPVLAGRPGCGEIVVPDQCPDEDIKVAAKPNLLHRISTALAALPTYFRNGHADVAEVRKLCPLPDTAHELKCVAQSLNAPKSSIVLGQDMTEAAVKRAPLNRYRIVHFATHGLLAGETAQLAKDKAEPALVFTPPDTASEEDDGLLTASEVATLKLDADWVVMSACNTAGGGAPGAEPLSGLARAFFYAGARALLVSHWPVNSYAATMLTSRTFAEMRQDPSLGRAEALRRAMLALMSDSKRPWAAHPSVWAPFVVVGEAGK